MTKRKNAENMGILRPKSSEKGPQIKGPKAKPSTKRDVPSVVTSVETWKSLAVGTVAVENTLLANVIQKAIEAIVMVVIHFLVSDLDKLA